MKYRFGTLFLLLSLFVAVSANRAWACESDNADHAVKYHQKNTEKPCCSDEEQRDFAPCAQDEDACNQSHPGQNCPPDDDGCGGCHCPGCGVVSVSHAGSLLAEFPSFLSSPFPSRGTKRQAFYFAQHMPEAVYLSIWQPPKIGA